MKKIMIGLTSFLLVSSIAAVFAQNFLRTPAKTTERNTIPSSRVMSKENFQRQVNQLGEQNLNSLTKQSQQQFQAPPPIPPQPVVKPGNNTNVVITTPTPVAAQPVSPPPSRPTPAQAVEPPVNGSTYTGFGGTTTRPAPARPADRVSGFDIQY